MEEAGCCPTEDPGLPGEPRPGEEEDVNPRNLAALFAADAERKKDGGQLQRSMQVAGAGLDDEFDLKKLQVFVRIRPSATKDAPRWDSENCIHATSRCSIAIAPPEASQAYKNGDRGQTYSFTRVFDEATPQQDYFDNTAAPLVRDLLRNPQHNSVMMAYGITAAGKTYTIEGTTQQPGVMPRALEMLFQGLLDHVEAITVRVAYYEVYNEQVFDLLEDAPVGPGPQRAALRLKEDSQGRVFVAGLNEVEVTSAEEALKVLRRGSRQRQRAETGLNYNSSRSHSIFTIMLHQPQAACEDSEPVAEAGDRTDKLGRMSFVDLAGSERAQRTGNVGVRLKESVAINSSLMTLGRCLEALRWNQQHKNANLKVVPYRESKVTHLFRDALHGWGQVVLSVNVSPCAKDYDETSHVLKYAALATQIGTIQQAEAPRRVLKAISPAIRKMKRKAGLPPEARGGKGGAKRAKKSPTKPGAGQEEPQGEREEGSVSPGPAEGDPAAAAGAVDACAAEGTAREDAEAEAAAEGEDSGLVGKVEFDGTPATPLDEEEEDGVVAELQAQIQGLVAQLQKAEEQCVLVETEVREEVAQEMEQLLREMEANYKERLASEVVQLECRLGGAPQAAAGAAKKGKGRGKAAAEPAEGAGGQLDSVAAAEQRAAQLQEQLDGLLLELNSSREQAQELQAAVEQANEQMAALQDQVSDLEQQLAAVKEVAAATEQQRDEQLLLASNLRTELEQAQAEKATLQTELEADRQQVAALVAEAQEMRLQAQRAQQEAARSLESTLQEEMTQMEANRAMEVEMLEEQLLRAKKDNAALKQRLEAAMATLATVASPSTSLMQRMAQACPAGNGRGAGGTPHDVALARARKAAAEELAAAAAGGAEKRGKGSGRTRFAGEPGRQAAASAAGLPEQLLADALSQPAAEVQLEEQQLEEGPAKVLDLEPLGVAGLPAGAEGADGQLQCGGVGSSEALPEAAEGGAVQPEQEGAATDILPAPAPAVPKQPRRRATRASALPPVSVLEEAAPAEHSEQQAAAAKPARQARKGRRAAQAEAEALAAISEAAEELQPEGAALAAEQPSQAEALQLEAGDEDEQQQQEVQQRTRKGGRKGRRRTTAASHTAPPADDGAQASGQQGEEGQSACNEPAAEPAAQPGPAVVARPGRRGRRTTVSTLSSINEEAVPSGGDSMPMEQQHEGAEEGAALPAAAGRRRASSARRIRRHTNKENSDEPAASTKYMAEPTAALQCEAIAEEPEEEEAAVQQLHGEEGAVQEAPPPAAAPAPPATASKRRRKLLPAKAESNEIRSALGELLGDCLTLADNKPAPAGCRPRRQTQFLRM